MILSTCCSEGSIVSGIEDNFSLCQDCVVLDLSLADGGTVVGEEDELGLSSSECLEGRLVSEGVFSALDDEAEFAVDVVATCFLGHD